MNRELVFVPIALVVACSSPPRPVASSEVSEHEYQVLHALLKGRWGEAQAEVYLNLTTNAICIEEIESLRATLEDDNPLATLAGDLFESFQKVCSYESRIDADKLGLPIASIQPDTSRRRNPKAFYLSVTRVGFSRAGDQALLELSCSGDICGSGEWVVLQIVRGRWREIAGASDWIH